jgi:hypothetical protein
MIIIIIYLLMYNIVGIYLIGLKYVLIVVSLLLISLERYGRLLGCLGYGADEVIRILLNCICLYYLCYLHIYYYCFFIFIFIFNKHHQNMHHNSNYTTPNKIPNIK